MAEETVETILAHLLSQIRMTNRLLAGQLLLASASSQTEVAALLANVGASNREIAEVLGTTTATVRVTLHRLNKKGRK